MWDILEKTPFEEMPDALAKAAWEKRGLPREKRGKRDDITSIVMKASRSVF